MTARSQALAVGTVPTAAQTVIYTTPVETTTIVKTVFLQNTGGSSVNVDVIASNGSTTVVLARATMAAAALLSLDLEVVLEAGHSLRLLPSVGAVLRYWVSGPELFA